MKREDCVQKIVKVAENNVEIRYILYDKDNKEIVINGLTESYGQDRIDNEKARWQERLNNFNSAAWIAKQKTECQDKLSLLDSIEIEMAKSIVARP